MTAGARSGLLALFLAAALSFAFAGSGDGAWLTKVSQKDRARANPMANDPKAVAAGAKLYKQNCAKCHGGSGEGVDKKPALTTERVRAATPGELE